MADEKQDFFDVLIKMAAFFFGGMAINFSRLVREKKFNMKEIVLSVMVSGGLSIPVIYYIILNGAIKDDNLWVSSFLIWTIAIFNREILSWMIKKFNVNDIMQELTTYLFNKFNKKD